MEFKNRLRALRLQHEMTQQELCEKLGVSVMTVRNWESGAKNPSMNAIVLLSEEFGVSADELLGIRQMRFGKPHMTSEEEELLSDYRFLDGFGRDAVSAVCAVEKRRMLNTHGKTVPFDGLAKNAKRSIPKFLNPSAAGHLCSLDTDDYDLIEVDETVPAEADFAIPISGSSMEPLIHDGDIVYVKRQNHLNIGEIGIFNVDGTTYCKMFYTDGEGNTTLISANPKMQSSNVFIAKDSNSTVVCHGKVLL